MSEPDLKPELERASGQAEEFCHKNRLQEYVQRASLRLPKYVTSNEGAPHAPRFRSEVWVDGTCFTLPNTYSQRKVAEQHVAKHALTEIVKQIKEKDRVFIHENLFFCKSIIHEYALKKNVNSPSYITNETSGPVKSFVSSLVFGGLTFAGDPGRTKKEAEQLAARSAILSILESEPDTTMSVIVTSKFKFSEKLKEERNLSSIEDGSRLVGVSLLSSRKRKESEDGGYIAEGTLAANSESSTAMLCPIQVSVTEPTVELTPNSHASYLPHHEINKSDHECLSEEVGPVIASVSSAPEPPLGSAFQKKEKHKKNKGEMKTLDAVEGGDVVGVTLAAIPEARGTVPPIQEAVAKSVVEQAHNIQVQLPHHEFRNPKHEPSREEVALPIVFVPPAMGTSEEKE